MINKYSTQTNNYQDERLHIIRSIVDELYRINNQEILLNDEQKEKRVRFTRKQEIDKIECDISTNELPSLQCECATQTIDMTYNELDRNRSTWISSKIMGSNQSLYSCGNNEILSPLSTAHQLILPSKAKHYDICQEHLLENDYMLFNSESNTCNSSFKSNRKLSNETNNKFYTSLKRKLSNNSCCSTVKYNSFNQDKLFEELHLSKHSLQSMYNDGLFYIHDLTFIFLKNMSEFNQILITRYHLSKEQANLFVQVMNKWWEKYRTEFIEIDKQLLHNNIIK
ncbi:unnamed protein product [Adineta steineri]|uniref:Uncharacterized protein n=1 Tax=Adineta steineri TaxID=433720 RepID=A0A819DE10_9BILA|nr:unnamed protein product [Adineta steineri]CAF3827530.1 unnamed protein product [Adineta steineri]